MAKKAISELSVDAQTLERVLRKANVGEVVSYDALSGSIGRDVRKGGRHLLRTARHRAFTQDGVVFDTVTDVGLKRLDDHGIVGTQTKRLTHIHRVAARSKRELAAVRDFAAMSNEDKIKHNTGMSLFGVLQHVTKEKTVLKLEATFEHASGVMPLAKMLEAVKANL
jgi:hypothetical protein